MESVYKRSSFKKKKRIKQLNTYAGLMMIKYEKQIIKGLLRIITKGILIFAIKIIILELQKLKK